MLIAPESFQRFERLRQYVFKYIRRELEIDGHHKSYEGCFEIRFPNYFESEAYWGITLHCYLLGPSRHYDWDGKTFEEALEKAIIDIKSWVVERKEEQDVC